MRYLFPALVVSVLLIVPAAADDFSACLQDANATLKLTGCGNLISLRPDMATAYCGRGDALADLGRTDEAIADYSHALTIDTKLAAAYYNRGLALLSQGKAKEAVADFDQAIVLDGSDATAYNAKAMALGALGEPQAAEAGFTKAISLSPNYVRAYLGRATLNLQLGRLVAAAADFDTVLRLHPGDREAVLGRQLASGKQPDGTDQAPASTSSVDQATTSRTVGAISPPAASTDGPDSTPAPAVRRAQGTKRHRKLASAVPGTADVFDTIAHALFDW